MTERIQGGFVFQLNPPCADRFQQASILLRIIRPTILILNLIMRHSYVVTTLINPFAVEKGEFGNVVSQVAFSATATDRRNLDDPA
jgi:hypothetical protein